MFFKVAVVSLLGYLALVPSPAVAPLAAAPPPVVAPIAAAPPSLPPPTPAVVVVAPAVSATRLVDVRRADLDHVSEIARGVRIVPALRHGAPSGLKVYAVRPGSMLAAIGLENGDTLLAINDLPLTSANASLEVYRANRGELDHFDIELERRGERVRIVVLVH